MVGAASHGRGMSATTEPILFTQAEQTVGRGLARRDAQALFEIAQNIMAAAQSTAEIGAHMQRIASRRLAQKQSVEGGHPKDVRKWKVQRA